MDRAPPALTQYAFHDAADHTRRRFVDAAGPVNDETVWKNINALHFICRWISLTTIWRPTPIVLINPQTTCNGNRSAKEGDDWDDWAVVYKQDSSAIHSGTCFPNIDGTP